MSVRQCQAYKMISRTFKMVLVRHGETNANREAIMQGQLDTELSDLGHEQAKLVGVRLQDVVFTHMVTSDLRRAADTAQAIVTANRVSNCSLVKDRLIRERCFGCLEGKPLSEFAKLVEKTGIPKAEFTPEGGETVPQVAERASCFLNNLSLELLQKPEVSQHSSDELELPESNVLVVSHGLMLRELRVAIMHHYLDEVGRDVAQEIKKISPNTGVSEFVIRACRKGDKLVLKVVKIGVLNDNSHLTKDGNNLTTHFKGAL